jgi:hypothetical protein
MVDGSKRYDFDLDNKTSVFIDSDHMMIVNSITLPRGISFHKLIFNVETVRVNIIEDSVCWSDTSSSSWTNDVEMQFMSPMMPKNFTPKQVKPCIKMATTTTTTTSTTTNNRSSYCVNNNRRKVVHFEAD